MLNTHTLYVFRTTLGAIAALAVVLMLCGCQHARYTDYSAFISSPDNNVPNPDYRLGPPDVIQIDSYRVREIDQHRETIGPDGYVHLQLIGPVLVAGRTLEDVRAEMIEKAQFYYEDADVNLRVIRYASKKFFVFGQVSAPGAYFYNGSNTILNTLAVAQPTHLADPTRILIMRPDANGEMQARMTIDLDRMVTTGDTSLDAVLQEGDIIYVPPSDMAAVSLAFQQVLLPLQPILQTVQTPADIANEATGRKPYGNEE